MDLQQYDCNYKCYRRALPAEWVMSSIIIHPPLLLTIDSVSYDRYSTRENTIYYWRITIYIYYHHGRDIDSTIVAAAIATTR